MKRRFKTEIHKSLAVGIFILLAALLLPQSRGDPVNPPPYDFQKVIAINNCTEHPDYRFLLMRVGQNYPIIGVDPFKIEPDRFAYPTSSLSGLTLVALPTTVFDSLFAVILEQKGTVAWNAFLDSDPRILHAQIQLPPIDEKEYRDWCKSVDDMFHITRLDSTNFSVVLAQVVYHFRNGQIQAFDYIISDHRPSPFFSPDKHDEITFSPIPYIIISFVSLIGFIVFLIRHRIRHT